MTDIALLTGALPPGIAYANRWGSDLPQYRNFERAVMGSNGLEYPDPDDLDILARMAQINDFGANIIAQGHSLAESCTADTWAELEAYGPECVDHAYRVFRSMREHPLPEDVETGLGPDFGSGQAANDWANWEVKCQPYNPATHTSDPIIRKIYYWNIRKTNDSNADNLIAAPRMQVQKLLNANTKGKPDVNGTPQWIVYNAWGSDVVYELHKGKWEPAGWDFHSWLKHSVDDIFSATKIVFMAIGSAYGGPALGKAAGDIADAAWALGHGGGDYGALLNGFVKMYAAVPGFVTDVSTFAKDTFGPFATKGEKAWNDGIGMMTHAIKSIEAEGKALHVDTLLDYVTKNIGKSVTVMVPDAVYGGLIPVTQSIIPTIAKADVETFREYIPQQYKQFFDLGRHAAERASKEPDILNALRDSIPWYAHPAYDTAATLQTVANIPSATQRAMTASMMYSPIALTHSQTTQAIQAATQFLSADMAKAMGPLSPAELQTIGRDYLREYVVFLLKKYRA